jgi:hypothetical protein
LPGAIWTEYEWPAQQSKDDLVVSKVVSELVNSVLEGAKIFVKDKKAQLSWYDDIEKLRPKKASCSEADLITTFIRYSQATGRRSWQAEFLLGCSLLSSRYVHERIRHPNERGCKSFARCIISLLNSLFSELGEEAFKVIPAMSGEGIIMECKTVEKLTHVASYTTDSPSSRFGQLSKTNCLLVGRELASALLRQSDNEWKDIHIRYAFDPAEILQLTNRS